MQVSAFKAFLPSKLLLAATVVIGVAIFWYVQLANQQADHIVRRNFNHLNQLTANIDRMHTGLQANLGFECVNLLEALTRAEHNQNILDTLIARLRVWAGSSQLIRDHNDISIAEDGYTQSKQIIKTCEGGTPQPTETAQSSTPSATRLEISSLGSNLVANGLQSEFLLALTSGAAYKQGKLWYRLTILQRFSLVNGLDHPESYFDTILVARGPAGKESNSLPTVFFNSSMEDSAVSEMDIRSLLNTSHRFDRFHSMAALDNAESEDMLRESDTSPMAEGDSQLWWNQSSLLKASFGGTKKLVFSQPLALPYLAKESPVIVGLVDKAKFNQLKFRLPLNATTSLGVLLLAGILSLAFVRLSVIPKHAIVHRSDITFVLFSVVGVTLLSIVFLMNVLASQGFDTTFDSNLKAIHKELGVRFEEELKSKLGELRKTRQLVQSGGIVPSDHWSNLPVGDECAKPPVKSDSCPLSQPNLLRCQIVDVKQMTSLFMLNNAGHQIGIFATNNPYCIPLGFDVSHRKYYARMRDHRSWHASIDGQTEQFYMERIETLSDAALETAISVYVQPDENGPTRRAMATTDVASQEPFVLVGNTRFQSLDFTALPPGFGFLIFDQHNGNVLFHSIPERAFRENIYRAVDDDTALKAAVISSSSTTVSFPLDLSYKGDAISATLSRLPNTDWMLATYYYKSLPDTINFRFSAGSVALAGIILLSLPALILLALWVWKLLRSMGPLGDSRIPNGTRTVSWLFPNDANLAGHIQLTASYAVLLWIYFCVVYFTDLAASLLWLLYIPVATLALWYFAMKSKPEIATKEESGTQNSERALYGESPGLAWTALPGRLMPGRYCTGIIAFSLLPLAYAMYVQGVDAWFLVAFIFTALVGIASMVVYLWFASHGPGADSEAEPPISKYRITDSALPWYRLHCCLFVMLIAVMPVVLLYNESYDVHERLWWDFHSWSIGERLKARHLRYQQYAADLGRSKEFSLANQLFSDGTTQGVYLPYSTIFSSLSSTAGADTRDPVCNALFGPFLNPREYKKADEVKAPGPNDTAHVWILRESASHKWENHRHFGADPAPHAKNDRVTDNIWMEQAAAYLPSFTEEGSLLRQFLKGEPDEQESPSEAMPEPCDSGKVSGNIYLVDYVDHDNRIAYYFDYFFPHNRLSGEFWRNIWLVFASGVLLILLFGYLMRRILICNPLPMLSVWNRELPIDGKPFALLVPHTCNLRDIALQVVDKLNPAKHGVGDLAGGHLKRLPDGQLVLPDLYAAICDQGYSAIVAETLLKAMTEDRGVYIITDIVPAYWLKHRQGADSPSASQFHNWERLLREIPVARLDTLAEPQSSCIDYRRAWVRSDKDEQMALAGLYYEGIVNARNRNTLASLLNRQLVREENYHLVFDEDPLRRGAPARPGEPGQPEYSWGQFLHDNLPYSEFKREARTYENSSWIAWRGPMLLALLALMCFLAYTAQDEVGTLLSLMATVATAIGGLVTMGDRLRSFQSLLGNSGGS
jgi:hypothetical protein